jgi:AcrR family transcriptional regulator
MIGLLPGFITSDGIHIPHLSKPEIEPQNPERLLTGRRVPAKTESVSESLDKITGDYLRLQTFIMPTRNHKIAPRRPRTDAQRNRERILETAKEAFTRSGANASLDDIAKETGVGAGTLYRHFPTRDALIEAVYRTEVEKLAAAEQKFSDTMPPVEALRAWMLLFVDYIATKQIIAPALNSIVGGPSKLYEGSRTQIKGAIDSLVKRAIKSCDIRKDLEPFDLLRALIGVSHVASGPDWQQSARRLVDILIAGSQPK